MDPIDLLGLIPERITPEDLRRLGQGLGGLTPWWLRPHVVERLEEERGWRFPRMAQLPRTYGSCWIAMAQREQHVWPSVKDAFFLPLHWQKDTVWDERLPDRLLALAKEVAVELELTGYSLHLHPVIQPPPPKVPSPPGGFEFDSAAISLAGGLYVAARNGEPDPAVCASACWKKAEGVLGVDPNSLSKKLELAAAWQMRAFFVAEDQLLQVQTAPPGLEMLRLPQGRSKLETAIQEFVVRQKAEPSAPNGLEDSEGLRRNVSHWAFLPAEHKEIFYQRRLLPWVLLRFADLILQEPDVAQARHVRALLTIVSGQKDTTILAARALSRLGIRHCLLLYSVDQKREQETKAAAIKEELGKPLQSAGQEWPVVSCSLQSFDPAERMLGQLADGVRTYCREFKGEQLVLDVTGGKTLMKWVTDHAMSAGSWRFCMENDEYIGNRPKPLTERPRLWPEFSELPRSKENAP